ncbi:MAG: hypothetical protein WBA68_04485, partial [Alteraurantiacibacter sp.]
MILRKGMAVAALACMATGAPLACAQQMDVIEIADDGQAFWVGGGPIGEATSVAPATLLSEIPAELTAAVPDHAVADTRLHAAGVPTNYAAHVAELARRFDLSPALLE